MNPPVPRLLLMCLALAFASVWLGCGPDLPEESTDFSELDEVPPCECSEDAE